MSDKAMNLEDAVELYLGRRLRGERIDLFEFAAEYPELGSELVDALEALRSLERATDGHSSDFPLPARIGEFRIVREIGRGGMGVVLEAV